MGTNVRKLRLTEQQRNKSIQRKKLRTKIANLVARNSEIARTCCICGKPGKILHNENNPYKIAFICDECRKDTNKLKLASEKRFDLRTKLNKQHKAYSNFTNAEIVKIVDNYLKQLNTIGDYCDKNNISRHQFHKLVTIYESIVPNTNIEERVTSHSQKIKAQLRNNKMEQGNIVNL